ncbi:hypothetical protein F8388_013489 [Cannabis sativa]|uniref:CCHC-type domain-containing protein n=1 Tax=Cannabis sativa TaxID=3483 RepID=A0A7J6HVF6_CANSA|nr:hypothetical protein F8388_013489 [Cannabis sativa]KAF4398370.1 hypothetical protein G4B88_025349 [Cannabis sativa]
MALVNAPNSESLGNGKCFSCLETSIKLSPCATSQQALSTLCLVGRVIAPMTVNEATILDFVDKTWKCKVSVVALKESALNPNCFEFGFARAANRDWALANGPWCVRGYSIILQAWSPVKSLSVKLESMQVWLQIHSLPRDYFSVDNGFILGGKAGRVISVDLEEGQPALWKKFLRVLVELDVNLPLFLGCYFEVASGGNRWIQIKYEKIGIFCYNCGKLGHQRRGCSLSSPVTVVNSTGVPYPMFGSWISTESTYLDVFSGAFSFSPAMGASHRTGSHTHRLRTTASLAVGGRGGSFDRNGKGVRVSMKSVKETVRRTELVSRSKQTKWIPKRSTIVGVPGISSSGNMAELGEDEVGKVPQDFARISLNRVDPHLNMALNSSDIDGSKKLAIGPAISSTGPSPTFKRKEKALAKYCGPCKSLGPRMGFNSSSPGGTGPLLLNNLSENGNGLGVRPILPLGPMVKENGVRNCDNFKGPLGNGPTKTLSNESSICGQEVNFHHDEELALSNFFQAQDTLLQELKTFGNLDLFEIKAIGGDIRVPTTSEVNPRTTPFKKRKFDGASSSLCPRPWKLLRPHPWAIRDFPWDTKKSDDATNVIEDEPSEDISLSNSESIGLDNWRSQGKNVISSRPMEGTFVVEDSGYMHRKMI